MPADGDQVKDWDNEQSVTRDPGRKLHWSLFARINIKTRSGEGGSINSREGGCLTLKYYKP